MVFLGLRFRSFGRCGCCQHLPGLPQAFLPCLFRSGLPQDLRLCKLPPLAIRKFVNDFKFGAVCDSQAPMPYNFAWAVKDDYTYNDYAHQETADDKGYVSGSYRVLLPDGRTQTVTYKADDYTGYVADVKYDGEAKYPEYKPAYPAYPAPAYPKAYPAYPAPAYPAKYP